MHHFCLQMQHLPYKNEAKESISRLLSMSYALERHKRLTPCTAKGSTYRLKEFGRYLSVLCIFVFFFCTRAYASTQRADSTNNNSQSEKVEIVALKNNLLYDAIMTPNLELEFRLTDHWSMEIGAGFNPFALDDTKYPKWRHVAAWVAPRYWFCHVFNRGFLSFNAGYTHYNVAGGKYPLGWIYKKVLDNRYQGDAFFIGESGGWHFAISPHFSIELEAGVDFGYTWYKEFECKHCGVETANKGHWFVLPKVGINLAFPLGGDKASLARRCDCEKIEEAPEETPVDTVVPEPEIKREPFIPASRLMATFPSPKRAVIPMLPQITIPMDQMHRLRSRLLRSEEMYEPYDINTALSADSRNVFLFFDVNVSKMDRSYLRNDMLMDSIMYILGEALADSTLRITRIQIVGFASFDGKLASNIRLAGSRAETIKKYIQGEFAIPDSVFAVCNGEESWAELKYQLPKVEFLGRDEVLEIIDTEEDADTREAKIKSLHGGATYRYMRDELKHILRNLGCITIYCEPNDDDYGNSVVSEESETNQDSNK